MEINLSDKRVWAKQRKIEADEIRRERKLAQDCEQSEAIYTFPAFVVWFSALICAIIFLLFSCQPAHAEVYDVEEIAEAIYRIEGGEKAKKPFGVLSVPCETRLECKAICQRTIENNFTRWQLAGQTGDFLEFLASRYAPLNAENDPKKLNNNWLNNLRRVLNERPS